MTTADAPALSYSSAPGRWVLAITVLARPVHPRPGNASTAASTRHH